VSGTWTTFEPNHSRLLSKGFGKTLIQTLKFSNGTLLNPEHQSSQFYPEVSTAGAFWNLRQSEIPLRLSHANKQRKGVQNCLSGKSFNGSPSSPGESSSKLCGYYQVFPYPVSDVLNTLEICHDSFRVLFQLPLFECPSQQKPFLHLAILYLPSSRCSI
jgi:hypothetical protein